MHFRQVFDQVFGLETTIAEVVFGLVLATIAAAVVLSWLRRRRGRPASRLSKHNPLEMGYALALAGIAVFLITVSFSSNANFFHHPPAALRVRVTAYQWCWTFSYTGSPVSVSGRCQGGPDPTLVLPAGEPVQVDLASHDVIHSFWIPGLKFKMDIYPGHVNSFTLTLRDGRWAARCAEFCGLYHTDMRFFIQAVPRARFGRWLRGHAHGTGGPA
jgi:cytochrome c oxidase subunit II